MASSSISGCRGLGRRFPLRGRGSARRQMLCSFVGGRSMLAVQNHLSIPPALPSIFLQCLSSPSRLGVPRAGTSVGVFWVVWMQPAVLRSVTGKPLPSRPGAVVWTDRWFFGCDPVSLVLTYKMQNVQVCHLPSVTIFPIPNNFAAAFGPWLFPWVLYRKW